MKPVNKEELQQKNHLESISRMITVDGVMGKKKHRS